MLKEMQSTRATESAVVRDQVCTANENMVNSWSWVVLQVDERNRALDVLIEALFLVCERFNRFKNTDLCMQIKSQPDVLEPDR